MFYHINKIFDKNRTVAQVKDFEDGWMDGLIDRSMGKKDCVDFANFS